MRAEIGRHDRDRALLAEPARGAQLSQLGLGLEAVAALDLDRRDALGEERVEPRQGGADELVLRRLAGGAHRRGDAAAGARDIGVALAGEPALELVGAVAGEDEMGVAVDQPRRDPAAGAFDRLPRSERRQLCLGAGKRDAPVPRRDRAALDDAESGPGHGREPGGLPQPADGAAALDEPPPGSLARQKTMGREPYGQAAFRDRARAGRLA